MKFLFGDIVVVENDMVGVVIKTWNNNEHLFTYEVYVRSYNKIIEYDEENIERLKVRHKFLDKKDLFYQNNNS